MKELESQHRKVMEEERVQAEKRYVKGCITKRQEQSTKPHETLRKT